MKILWTTSSGSSFLKILENSNKSTIKKLVVSSSPFQVVIIFSKKILIFLASGFRPSFYRFNFRFFKRNFFKIDRFFIYEFLKHGLWSDLNSLFTRTDFKNL